MQEINNDLKKYIEENIFPIYEKNDAGHNLEHINYVIKRCLKFSKQFSNINLDMVYATAAYHDIAHHIDKDNHETLSAKWFYEDENTKKFFSEEERLIIKEAIEDHRASLEREPRSDYGKIVSSADRSTDIKMILKRTHLYSLKHYPKMNLEEMIDRAYKNISQKYGSEGYAKNYCLDEEYNQFKKEVKLLLKDKNEFINKYLEVNGIKNSNNCK